MVFNAFSDTQPITIRQPMAYPNDDLFKPNRTERSGTTTDGVISRLQK